VLSISCFVDVQLHFEQVPASSRRLLDDPGLPACFHPCRFECCGLVCFCSFVMSGSIWLGGSRLRDIWREVFAAPICAVVLLSPPLCWFLIGRFS